MTLLALPAPAAEICVYYAPLCQAYWYYDAVFDGTFISIERRERKVDVAGPRQVIPYREVTFAVHQTWKGIKGRRVKLHLGLDYDAFIVKGGERYMIFANKWSDHLSADNCSPSTSWFCALHPPSALASARQAALNDQRPTTNDQRPTTGDD